MLFSNLKKRYHRSLRVYQVSAFILKKNSRESRYDTRYGGHLVEFSRTSQNQFLPEKFLKSILIFLVKNVRTDDTVCYGSILTPLNE